jgi:hypothetical protein
MMGSSSSGSHGPKDHGLLLFLSGEHLMGLAKLQVKLGLGRTYAGLYLFNEGLHSMDCITDEDYQRFKAKYSEKLVAEHPKPRTTVELKAREQDTRIARDFSLALSQWATMNEKSRKFYVDKANSNPAILGAKLILELASKEVI